MKSILLFFLLLVSYSAFAQNPRVNPNPSAIFKDCDLGKKNEIWWNKILSEPDTMKKFELIKEKIFADTFYKQYKTSIKLASSPSETQYSIDKNGNLCDAKILFVLSHQKKGALFLDLLTHPEYIDFLKFVDCKNATLTLLSGVEGGTALYGQRGMSGVVHIKIINKKLKQKVNHILRNQDH